LGSGNQGNGLYLIGTNNIGLACNSTKIIDASTTKVIITTPLAFSNLSSKGLLGLDSSSNVTSTNLTNGQLLIGNTSNPPTAATLTGTTNQVNVTNGSGSITLSTPQNIDLSANVQFLSAITGPTMTRAGSSRLYVTGTDSSFNAGPFQTYYTNSDQYPLLQVLPFAHNNVCLNFDSYYDGTWRSSASGSNFSIQKSANQLQFLYNSGIAAGSALTWNTAGYFDSSGVYHSNKLYTSTGQPCWQGFMAAPNTQTISTGQLQQLL